MATTNRILAFHTSVDERFAFLAKCGLSLAERRSVGDRYGAVRFNSPYTDVAISWDAYDGNLEATINEQDVWDMLVDNGEWRGRGYQGFAVDAMQHGLDRIAKFLSSRPELLRTS